MTSERNIDGLRKARIWAVVMSGCMISAYCVFLVLTGTVSVWLLKGSCLHKDDPFNIEV